LPGALAVTPRLVGIDLAHAFEQFLRIGFIDFRGARPFTPAAATWRDRSILLSLVRHTTISVSPLVPILHTTTWQKNREKQGPPAQRNLNEGFGLIERRTGMW
jgi:hypothetical protein